jgi:hypothetical protein
LKRVELRTSLDALGNHEGAEVLAKVHHATDQGLLSVVAVHAFDESPVDLDHAWFQIGDALEVRVSGAEVIDDEVELAAAANLSKDAHAQVEVGHGDRLGDLQIDFGIVGEDRIVGAYEPTLPELGGVDVDEDGNPAAQGDGYLPNEATEASHTTSFDGVVEEFRGRLKLWQTAAHEGFAGEGDACRQVHDGLKHNPEIVDSDHGLKGDERVAPLVLGILQSRQSRRNLREPELRDLEAALGHADLTPRRVQSRCRVHLTVEALI